MRPESVFKSAAQYVTQNTPSFCDVTRIFWGTAETINPGKPLLTTKTRKIPTRLFPEDEDALVGPLKSDRLLSCGVVRTGGKKLA